MATKRLRGARWEYIVRRKSLLPKPLYLYFSDESEGDEYVARLEKLLDHGIVPEQFQAKDIDPDNAVRDILRSYETAAHLSRSDEALIKRLYDMVGDVPVVGVNYDWAEAWVREMIDVQELSPVTIRHYVGALARCFDWAQKKGHLINPLRLLPKGYASKNNAKKEEERDRRLSHKEELKFVKHLQSDPDALVFWQIANETGMRMREIFTLRMKQLDFKNLTIFLFKTKTGTKRQIPMSVLTEILLREYTQDKKKNDIVFPWWNGDESERELDKTTSKLSKVFKRHIEDCGIKDYIFRDTRHEAASRFYESTTLNDGEIMKIMGWKDIKMAMRYANLRGSSLARKIR